MKKFTVLASSLSLSLLVAAMAGCNPQNTTGVETPKMTEAQYIKRGAYIANTSECLACHTPIRPLTKDGTPTGEKVMGPDGKQVVAPDTQFAMLGGGNAWFTPEMGIGISPNLTPYPGSDIKELTVDQLAAKWSQIKDGQLLPPMPGLAKYELEDLKALAYYFKSVPAIEAKPPATYKFKDKTKGDKTWPAPGWVQGEGNTGGVIPGALEISVAPGSNLGFGQPLIDANIEAANPGN